MRANSVTVPGAVAGAELAAKTYGTRPLSELLAPAVELADRGFPITESLAGAIRSSAKKMSASAREIWFRGDTPLGFGDRVIQKDLAATLREIGAKGSAAFYQGPIAEKFAAYMKAEGGLIGQMMLLALARAGVATINRLQLGPTAILRQALLSGAVDLCVEYTGNAAIFFHEEGDPLWRDARAGYARAAALDYAANRLVWLQPAPADNSWVIAIPNALAREKGIRTLDDFAAFVRAGERVKLAASADKKWDKFDESKVKDLLRAYKSLNAEDFGDDKADTGFADADRKAAAQRRMPSPAPAS